MSKYGGTSLSGYDEARQRIRSSFAKTKSSSYRKKKTPTTKPKIVRQEKEKWFKRPGTLSPETKKYCRCLAEVGAKQSESCLRTKVSKGKATVGSACYNPYAICGRLKPPGMKGGCAMLYNYQNMPYALAEGTAAMHNKSVKELVEAARKEASQLKWES
ncbi:MAG: hypothetical protein P4L69_07225 [Desulfosporosinus sp.]|nr:hypothetical protein [Desulfosporosinus sp.]